MDKEDTNRPGVADTPPQSDDRHIAYPPLRTPPLPNSYPFDAAGALCREYLLERGYCCGLGCRNCPYKEDLPSLLA